MVTILQAVSGARAVSYIEVYRAAFEIGRVISTLTVFYLRSVIGLCRRGVEGSIKLWPSPDNEMNEFIVMSRSTSVLFSLNTDTCYFQRAQVQRLSQIVPDGV